MGKEKSEITHEGMLSIGDIEIPCYVLKNGTRVISGRAMQNALLIGSKSDKKEEEKPGNELTRFLSSKWFQEQLTTQYDHDHFKPITCYKGNQRINGFEATTLADICNIMLDARLNRIIKTERQSIIAAQCEILIRSFAKVGIIALIDEATGYQEIREKDALKRFLEKFLVEEKGKWVKTFPDEFFEMIFKMKGWTWSFASNKKPGVVGHYINDIVYARIGPHVLQELKERNPINEKGNRAARHHQFLSPDYGNPKLKEHITAITALGRASGFNWNNFMRLLNRAFPKYGGTIEIDFNEAD